MMNDNALMVPISKEKEKLIQKLEEVLIFLKSTQIKNEEYLDFIKKPIDDLQLSLKYLPTETSFKILPAEIKRNILSYLCDSNAFIAASVCQEWKEIFETRFIEKAVNIGKRCCSKRCKDEMCLKPSQMLKALATHRLDFHLSITDPIKRVNSKIVTEALTSVSEFTINGESNCTCEDENGGSDSESVECDCEHNPLSFVQLEDLFRSLEKGNKIVEKVEIVEMDLTKVNQDRLVHCFLNKIKNLTLHKPRYGGKMFDVETFTRKLSQESAEMKLTNLTLQGYTIEYTGELSEDLANALCNVEHVKLLNTKFKLNFDIDPDMIKQLLENVLSEIPRVKIKTLLTEQSVDFRTLINPEDLKKLCNKMTKLELKGRFTLEQVEAAKSLPNVEVSTIFNTFIRKGF